MRTTLLPVKEMDKLGQAVYFCDTRGYITYYNAAAVKLWGRLPVPGKDVWCGAWKVLDSSDEPLAPDHHPARRTLLDQPLHSGEPLRLMRPDGSVRTVIPFPSKLFNRQGKTEGVLVHLLEKIPAESNEELQMDLHYQTIFQQSEDGIFIFDHEGNFLAVNDSGCNLLGFSQAELSAMNLYDIIPAVYKGKLSLKLAGLQPGECATIIRKFVNRNGEGFHGEVKSKVLPNGNIQAVLRDITRQKLAEENMLNSRKQLDILSRATNDVIWDWDIVKGCIYYGNSIERMLGYELTEVKNIDRWWLEKIHPDDQNRVKQYFQELFRLQKHEVVLTYRFRAADDSYRFIYDRGMVIYNQQGKPLRVAGVMQDITHRNETDTQIARLIFEAQESVRQQIGAELHDNVNQILTGCLMHIAQIRNCDNPKAGELAELSREYILTAIQELRKLSHRLVPATDNRCSTEDMFRKLVETMNVSERIKIRMMVEEQKAQPLDYDLQLNLFRMLQEQLTNIVRHADATEIHIQLKQNSDAVWMRISDNGCGFDKETVKMGFGLSNIRKRIQLMDGDFILNTEAGKGCELIAVIPSARPTAAA